MENTEVEVTRRLEFSASHRLHAPTLDDEENRRIYGICNNPNGHGHNYVLEVTARGVIPAEIGFFVNFFQLDEVIEERLLRWVDHKHLNHDVPFLEGIVPTAENMVLAFWRRLEPPVNEIEGCRLHRIRLYESASCWAEMTAPAPSAPGT